MDPDIYQQAWQADTAQTRVTIHADLLLNEVQRHQRSFQATVFWRDVREVGGSLLMIPLWFYLGHKFSSPWTFYLTVPVLLWIAAFLLVDRIRHRCEPDEASLSLVLSVKDSLQQVEHQIWLLRNIFWWYLLPPSISILAFFVHVSWLSSSAWWEFVGTFTLFGIFLVVIYAFVYYINLRAVRTDLEPRRQELQKLLSSLSDETGNASDADSYEIVPASLSPFAVDRNVSHRGAAFRNLIAAIAVVGFLILAGPLVDLARRVSGSNFKSSVRSSGERSEPLARVVSQQRKAKELVGLAAMVMVDGKVEAAAAQGERKFGSGVSVEISDRWHVGGITKAITATMIARLVESNQLQWSDSVGEAFPDSSMHDDWKAVTLHQLLTDTAGAPAQFPRSVWTTRIPMGPERIVARRNAVLDVIAKKPQYPAGTMNVYSNVGYTIAGSMAEKVTGATWENLVIQEVFEPLELKGSGFGPPTSPDRTLPQPRGHRTRLAGKVAVDDETDNGPIMGPAATIHMTLKDMCTFATEHMRGELGHGKLLSAETYQFLHAPELNQYACGWIQNEPDAAIPYTTWWHNGSNTLWYAQVAFIPETNRVVAITSNDGDMEMAAAAALKIMTTDSIANHPKLSPFAAVRWNASKPEVRLREEWFQLILLNDVSVAEIVEFSRKTYGDKWQKRFEEDLVELMARMGHPTNNDVNLVVQSLTSGEQSVRKNVPMTEDNRKAIRNEAR
ncbi:D-alanyl-D-alanine carboxypeptidase precursor [Rubripirellula tenax]|uniref:D-alanyl-D-alanine carboxypeptidase n=1 Tax=Rubripirellula tenax TaxID=2528015 RepID=A0A5C6EFH8_9BACT|nr:serine hydrolase domain-containing protein [Rubripirellula tenax]TWU47265.1 D-alanyl-D-alanine carboxypeptidase precursor [Rubripirellula tenax]